MASLRLVVIGVMLVALTTAHVLKRYPTYYEHICVDEILNNYRLVTNYLRCILDQGRCPPEGKDLKKWLPKALKTKCRRCSDKEMEFADKGAHYLYYRRRSDYDEVAAKYDPAGVYRKRYEPKYLRPEIEASTVAST